MVMVQHISAAFAFALANRRDTISLMTVKLVAGGELICDGPRCLAVEELHARLVKRGADF